LGRHIQGIGAVAGLVAFGLSIYLGLRAAGVFERPEYELTSSYLAPHDIIGFPTMPHFVVMYRNVGNVPVTFSDFELKYPRLDAVDNKGDFILTPGADLYIDKRLSSRLGGAQQYKKIDYRTNKVELAPGAMHTDFFDLGALLGWKPEEEEEEEEEGGYSTALETRTVPTDFHPVLTFTDSFGNELHCDEDGVHLGPYRYPHERAFRAGVPEVKMPHTLEVARSRLRWRGWTHSKRPYPNADESA
jgi:hypothetical protein